jgi:hypothetical protein
MRRRRKPAPGQLEFRVEWLPIEPPRPPHTHA